jgi:nucleotide-binding universal stress UspA family protein
MSSADRIHEDWAAALTAHCSSAMTDPRMPSSPSRRPGDLVAAKPALVVTVWQLTAGLNSFAWSGASAGMVNFVELDRAGAEDGCRVAHEGVRIAHEAGLEAEPVAIKATGSVWETIIQTAAHHNAAAILMGSRGLTGVRSMLLGSVSSAVVQHAVRASLVIYRRNDEHAAPDQPT